MCCAQWSHLYMQNEETELCQPYCFCPQQEKWSAHLISSAAAVDFDHEGGLNNSIGSFPAQRRLAAGK